MFRSTPRSIAFRFEAWDIGCHRALAAAIGGVSGSGLLTEARFVLTHDLALVSGNGRTFTLLQAHREPTWRRMLSTGEVMTLVGTGRRSFTVRSPICGTSVLLATRDPELVPARRDAYDPDPPPTRYITGTAAGGPHVLPSD